MFKKYYLAYGSNLNIKQMKQRCPTAKYKGTTYLKNFRLVYKGSANNFSYLTLEKCEGYSVPLGIYEISYFDIFSLDRYEGYPTIYSKYYISIKIENKNQQALIYIMNSNFNYHFPSKKYEEICLEGYENFGFNKSILENALIDTIANIPKTKKKSLKR